MLFIIRTEWDYLAFYWEMSEPINETDSEIEQIESQKTI